jgi:hypothetical protein
LFGATSAFLLAFVFIIHYDVNEVLRSYNWSYLKTGGAEVKAVNKSLIHYNLSAINKRFDSQGNNISYPSTYTGTNRTTLQLELQNYYNVKH